MFSMWNMDKRQQAADYFADAIGTKEAKSLAAILKSCCYFFKARSPKPERA